MSDPSRKPVEIGVVLQGGGALGAYECGALDALLELMDEFERQGCPS
jgi:NTE family protein